MEQLAAMQDARRAAERAKVPWRRVRRQSQAAVQPDSSFPSTSRLGLEGSWAFRPDAASDDFLLPALAEGTASGSSRASGRPTF